MNVTLIDDLEYKQETLEKLFIHSLDSQDIRKNAIDLFLDPEIRMKYLEMFYDKEPGQFNELISCINGMYFFSRANSVKEYITQIANNDRIPLIYRIECSKNLGEDGYTIINCLCNHETFKYLPTPIRTDIVLYVMNITKTTQKYKEESLFYFCSILNDTRIDNLYRFKLIQKLENLFKDELFDYYVKESCYQFVTCRYNHMSYRVICCQYIFQKCKELYDFSNTFLLEIASDPLIDEDIRADACDILLGYGTSENVEKARMILFVIGGGDRMRNNVFKNSQNVHNHSIESSVEKIIEYISSYVSKKSYTFDKVKDELEEMIKNHEKYTILKDSITRITIDRAIYGRLNYTLSAIITKMWSYIQDSEYKEELEKRLIEELVESYNKCSSGYVSRIVNTISGFGEMSVQISFEDQIVSVLESRLNKQIYEEEEKDIDLILEEMTLPVRFYDKRGNFLKFFRKNISIIREEMYTEFKEYITSQDFDLYFRKAISHYEGCSF
jgi:hypothetical protein